MSEGDRDMELLKEWLRAYHEERRARMAMGRGCTRGFTQKQLDRHSRAKGFVEAAEIALAYSNGADYAESLRKIWRSTGTPAPRNEFGVEPRGGAA